MYTKKKINLEKMLMDIVSASGLVSVASQSRRSHARRSHSDRPQKRRVYWASSSVSMMRRSRRVGNAARAHLEPSTADDCDPLIAGQVDEHRVDQVERRALIEELSQTTARERAMPSMGRTTRRRWRHDSFYSTASAR